ncbi:MAG: pilus assembly protein [Vampirovibrionales bacterium]|nr:pilus assembly protein [Vampirovibrionales bacterium]
MNVRVCHRFCSPLRLRGRSRGQAMIEMTANIIMFVLMITVVASMSAYLYVQQAIVTAAREGARIGSLNQEIGAPATSAAGVDAVKTYVVSMVQRTTGLIVMPDDIDVTPPDPALPVGERSVEVVLDFSITNPLPVEPLLAAFSGGNSYNLGQIPIHAEATMRYEE